MEGKFAAQTRAHPRGARARLEGGPIAPDWPARISFARLGVPMEELQRQQWGSRPLPHRLRGEGVHVQSYGGPGPSGHGLVTTVYFVVAARVFYLHSNCGQGHMDGILGPFQGDPREVLAATDSGR